MTTRTIPRAFTACALLAASLLAVPAAHADIVNKVSVSGRITYESDPLERITPNTYTVGTRLEGFSVTNSALLDVLISMNAIPYKAGYTIIERFDTDGYSLGHFARNARTGHTVALDSDLFSSQLSGSSGPQAYTDSYRADRWGDFYLTGSKTNFAMVTEGSIFDTYITGVVRGATNLVLRTVRINGGLTPVQYNVVGYTSYVQGLYDDAAIIEAKITSNGTTYSYDPETGTGFESAKKDTPASTSAPAER